MNRKKERTKSPHLKAFQIKFRYGGSLVFRSYVGVI